MVICNWVRVEFEEDAAISLAALKWNVLRPNIKNFFCLTPQWDQGVLPFKNSIFLLSMFRTSLNWASDM